MLTFQEGTPGDPFDRIRARIREGGRIRQLGTGYLAYALMDATIDAYYPVLEVYAERLDELEDLVTQPRNTAIIDRLHAVKADLLILRRAFGRCATQWPCWPAKKRPIFRPKCVPICATATTTSCRLSSWSRRTAN